MTGVDKHSLPCDLSPDQKVHLVVQKCLSRKGQQRWEFRHRGVLDNVLRRTVLFGQMRHRDRTHGVLYFLIEPTLVALLVQLG